MHNNKEKAEQGSIDSEVIAGAQPLARETLEGGQSEEAYGPWMVVTRKKKDNKGAKKSNVSVSPGLEVDQ